MIEMIEPTRLPVKNLINVVSSRRCGLEMALKVGFSRPEATKIAVVISELARNITLYTEGGTITLIPQTGQRRGIKVIAQDKGPGIENVDRDFETGSILFIGRGLNPNA